MRTRSRNHPEEITYWPPNGSNVEGHEQFGASVSIKARWEDHSEEFNTTSGETAISNAKVFVSQDVDTNGYLYRGTSNAVSPHTLKKAYQIRDVARIPNLRHVEQQIVAIV